MYLPEWLKVMVEIMIVAYVFTIAKLVYDLVKEIINYKK